MSAIGRGVRIAHSLHSSALGGPLARQPPGGISPAWVVSYGFKSAVQTIFAAGWSRGGSFSTSNIRRSTLPAPSGAALRAALRAGYLTSSTLRSGSLRSIQHPRLRAGGPSPHVLANVATFRRLLPFHPSPLTPHLSSLISHLSSLISHLSSLITHHSSLITHLSRALSA